MMLEAYRYINIYKPIISISVIINNSQYGEFCNFKGSPRKKTAVKTIISGHFGAADGANFRVFSETFGVEAAVDLSASALHAHPAPRRKLGRPLGPLNNTKRGAKRLKPTSRVFCWVL